MCGRRVYMTSGKKSCFFRGFLHAATEFGFLFLSCGAVYGPKSASNAWVTQLFVLEMVSVQTCKGHRRYHVASTLNQRR